VQAAALAELISMNNAAALKEGKIQYVLLMNGKKVRVGVMDTGVQADHPDIHPNFDYKLSRNFVTDLPSVDGPCEHASCVDPVGEDDGGHGTHVSGTIAASLNGFGVSGVAPSVDIVEVRAGQDSGFFFAGPTLDALTYSGDAGLDVVNMSFYVDPWLYNCVGGAPEDTPAQANDQNLIIAAVWVNPAARDAEKVYANNRTATREALRAGVTGMPQMTEVLAARHRPFNPFYSAPAGGREPVGEGGRASAGESGQESRGEGDQGHAGEGGQDPSGDGTGGGGQEPAGGAADEGGQPRASEPQ